MQRRTVFRQMSTIVILLESVSPLIIFGTALGNLLNEVSRNNIVKQDRDSFVRDIGKRKN